MQSYLFEALGSPWRIETEDEISETLKQAIQQRIEVFDATYSRFRKDSLVTVISKKAGEYEFPDDARRLFGFYKELYAITKGKVTPLVGDMIVRAGYDAEYSLKPKPQKPVGEWDAVMQWVDTSLRVKEPVTLDLGAAGKGYLVDIIANLLEENRIKDYVIDASGDLKHKGSSENNVGLEHPLNPGKIIGIIDVRNKSLCASASNRRVWGEGMHHIFDPTEMAPTQNIIATWVIAEGAIVADGLATALFFVEPEKLQAYDFEYVRIKQDGTIQYSPVFENALFFSEDPTNRSGKK